MRDVDCVLGFDVGGTNIRAALADARGVVLAEGRTPTVKYAGQGDYGRVFALLRDELAERGGVDPSCVRAAGAAVAGVVDPGTRRIVMALNISVLPDFDLRAIMSDALGLGVRVENDVNLAAVGEHWRGAAQGCRDFIFVAIGTGIGAGMFVGGRLYRGAHNAAGRLGHLYVRGPEAEVGDGLGALERHASGPAIVRKARERLAGNPDAQTTFDPNRLAAEDVWAAAAQGDLVALNALDEAIETLALGLANAAMLLDPALIVLGGGVSRAGDALLTPLRERLPSLLMHPIAPRLELSQLGTNAQLYGAIRLVMRNA